MDAATRDFVQSLPRLTPQQALIHKSNISRLLNLDEPQDQTYKFPGAQPVSLEKTGLSEVLQNDYMVCEKTDGTRHLFYVDLQDMTISPEVYERLKTAKSVYVSYYAYFIDREYQFYQAQCDINLAVLYQRYALRNKPYDPAMFAFFSALFDGEIVADKAEAAKQAEEVAKPQFQTSFYLFDTMYFGKSYMNEFLDKRLEKCQFCVKYKLFVCRNVHLCGKLFVDKLQLEQILSQQKELRHGSDGIIFTKVKAGYFPGTTQNIQKWKPINQNSVDLHVETGSEIVFLDKKQTSLSQVKLYVASRGILESTPITPGGIMYLSEKSFQGIVQRQKKTNPLILEVFWDAEKEVTDYVYIGSQDGIRVVSKVTKKGGWSSIKFRVDKQLPNDRRVFNSVMKAYDEFIDIHEIMQIIAGKREIPGVCTATSPFLLQKLGYIRVRTVDEEFAV